MKRMKTLVLLVALFGLSWMFGREVFFRLPDVQATPVEVVIEQGATVKDVARVLKEKKLITHPWFVSVLARWMHVDTKLQSGTFEIRPNTSTFALLLILSNPLLNEISVTIPEGYTNNQIEEKLAGVLMSFDRSAWKSQTKNMQGYLFPDTYRFPKDVSVEEVIKKMRANLDTRLLQDTGGTFTELPEEKRLHEIITMASLIEKEVKTPEDMAHVARVFYNRMFIGMPLQTDADVWTYKNRGLPPEPVCNPGMNAIMAVLHPLDASVKDLYFVAPPDHAPVFAKTLEEHNRNIKRYLGK